MMMMMKHTVKIDKLQLNGNFLNSFKNKQMYLKDIHLKKNIRNNNNKNVWT